MEYSDTRMEYSDTENETLKYYAENKYILDLILLQVQSFFQLNPQLNCKPFPIMHSLKSRIKDPDHLIDKIRRKNDEGRVINKDNLFEEIRDLVGVRVLYIYQDQFPGIHEQILNKINEYGEWCLVESPKAYTWDPESKHQYEALNIATELKDSYYTSVHYVIKLNNPNPVCCEIQVRSLFEEIWGEIDHTINYPHQTSSIACREQLRVLSKLVSTGTRLADSIFRSYNDISKV